VGLGGVVYILWSGLKEKVLAKKTAFAVCSSHPLSVAAEKIKQDRDSK